MNFFISIFLLLMSLLILPGKVSSQVLLNEEEQSWLADHPVIRIGVDPHYAPYSYRDESGNYQGAAVDLIDHLADLLDVSFEIVPDLEWNQIVEAGRNKELDVIATIVKRPERDVFLNFTSAYLSTPLVILQRKGELSISQRDDLNHLKVALVKGYSSSKRVISEYPGVQQLWVDKPLHALQAVASGQADAHVGSIGVSSYIAAKAGIANLQVVAGFDLNPTGQRFGVRKDWPLLVAILEKALATISETEKLAILHRWVPVSVPTISSTDRPSEFRLTAAEKEWLEANKPLQVGVMDGWPPFNYVDESGQSRGIGMDYISALEQRIGKVFRIVPGEWKRIYDDVKEKRLDLILDITPKPDREPYFNFTSSYMSVPHVIVAGKNIGYLESELDLEGKTLALEKGFGNVKYFQQAYPKVKLSLYANTGLALDAVSRGDADAYAGNRVVALYVLQENFITNLRIHGRLTKPASSLAIGVRKDWIVLRNILQRALMDIDANEHRDILYRSVAFTDLEQVPETQLVLTEKERNWIREHPEIHVGGEANWPPFDKAEASGLWQGITPDVLHLILKRLGLRAKFTTEPTWSEKLDMLRERKLDVMGSMAYSEQRAEYLNFAGPYFTSPYVVVTRRSETAINSLQALEGRRVALESGYFLTDKLKKDYPQISLHLVDNTIEALLAVSDETADAYIGNRAVVSYLMDKELLTNLKVALSTPFPTSRLHFGVRKDQPMLRDLFQKALDTISDAELKEIRRKWLPAIEAYPQQEIASVQLTDDEKAWLAAHKTIRLGVHNSWAPLEFIDEAGQYKGLSTDYMQIFAKQLGFNLVQPESMQWSDVLKGLQDRTLDIAPLVARTPERESYLTYTKPYLDFPLVIYNQRSSRPIAGLGDLDGQNVAVVKGYAVEEYLRRDYPDWQLELFPSIHDALHALSVGSIDAFVGSLAVGGYLIGTEGLSNLQVAAPTPYRYHFSIGVRKDMPKLVTMLNKAIDTLTEEKKNEIYRRWLTLKYEYQVDYTLLWKVLFGFLAVALVASLWVAQIRRSHRAQQASQQRLALTMDSARLGSWEIRIDQSGHHSIKLDKWFLRHLAMREDEQKNYNLEEIFKNLNEDDVPDIRKQMSAFLNSRDNELSMEFRVRNTNRWLHNMGHTMERDEKGRPSYVIGITQDFTDHHRITEALEQSSRLKGEFLANMSHEIRTPMNAVIGLAHLLSRTSMDKKQQDYVHKIQLSASSLLGIIDDILDFSKIEAGRLNIEIIPFSLNSICENVAMLAHTKISEKPVEFLYDIDLDIPNELIGDPYRIGQILTNLISNAAKFTEHGYIIVRVRQLKRKNDKVRLRFEVEDSGVGIAADKLEQLFEAFIQEDGSTTREFGGTGLGLSISQQLCSLMGGEIGVTSEKGKGSLFWFELPLKFSMAKGLPMPVPDLRGLNVLLVDDNPQVREVLSKLLASMSFNVTLAASGMEALTLMHEPDRAYDVVLLDWRMPGIDGYQAAQRISDEFGDNRPIIIIMTAYGREAIENEADLRFTDGFLIKPLTASLIFDAIIMAYESQENKDDSQTSLNSEDSIRLLEGRILLVEDNQINQQVAQELLEQIGLTVDAVSNGQKAVEYVKKTTPDLVLMDIQMPVMDGYEATRAIRLLPEHEKLPIIAMTANAMASDEEKSHRAGMNDYIFKPVDPDQLYSLLEQYLPYSDKPVPQIQLGQPASVTWSLPDLNPPGIDLKEGVKRVGGNPEFYRRLLFGFVNNHGNCIEEIEGFLSRDDFDKARITAHTIKGVSANIGASEVHEQAAVLEKLFEQHQMADDVQWKQFTESCNVLFESLQQLVMVEKNTVATGDSNRQMEKQRFDDFIMALEQASATSTSLYETLKPWLKTRLSDEQMSSLDNLIEDYEFESAGLLLRDLLKEKI
ncbi:MAG: transporter substrate-binding domain-containing protein [Candidatus Thiodiazotropha taylori]